MTPPYVAYSEGDVIGIADNESYERLSEHAIIHTFRVCKSTSIREITEEEFQRLEERRKKSQ